MEINLNLPTLPTSDQKDAMDNANAPDGTNVFITANDLTIPTLQEVTDEGNTTTNDIQFDSGAGILLDNTSRLREGTIDAGFGGTKGIAQICAVGYELKWEAGRLYVMDGNGVLIRHSLHNFTTVPSANDDATKGYYVGSLWSLDSGVSYICTDSTTASATWDLYYDIIPNLQQVTDIDSITTNTITVGDITADFSELGASSVGVQNAVAGTYSYLDSSGYLGFHNGTAESDLKNTNVTNAGVILEFPNKATGSYTIATTQDLPAAQVNSDWNATSGVAEILNKPSIPAAQIQSDWNQTNNTLLDYIKNKPTVGSGDMTKAVYDTDNSGIVDNAEAIIIIGRNSTGATLRKGTIIYISGSTGNRPNFVKAKADSEATSAGTFGVIVNDISNNSDGNCCVLGYLDTLDTRTTATYPFTNDTLSDGDTIYLSPTTAGYITNVKPSAPNHLVYLGKVTRTSPTNGTIIYRIQNGYELNEIHDVAISSVADKDLLAYESSTSLWKNKSASTLGIVETSDSRLTDTRTRKVAVQSNTDASTSATIAETVLKTLLVPTLGANTTLKIMSQVGKVGVAVNAVFKMYYNTTPDLSGSPVQIALLNFTLTQVFSPFQRDITNKNSVTTNSIFSATLSSATEIITTSARTDLNVNLSGKYIVITGKAGSVADSVRVDNARLLIEE